MRLLAIAAALALAACAAPKRPDIPVEAACPRTPVPIEIERIRIVPVPDRLTAPVLDPDPSQPETFGEAVQAADRRAALLAACDARLREIESLAPEQQP